MVEKVNLVMSVIMYEYNDQIYLIYISNFDLYRPDMLVISLCDLSLRRDNH